MNEEQRPLFVPQMEGQLCFDDAGPSVKVGQVWRDPEDSYLYRVVHIDDRGEVWCRHPNAKQGGNIVRRAWFARWDLVRDA